MFADFHYLITGFTHGVYLISGFNWSVVPNADMPIQDAKELKII
ncbi:MAG: hypothetical protein Q7T80_03075 [Methanoregula sp.]|nr:hypothetical protein [Methanoregula sp.]